jgi:hypothetical protein
MVTPEQEIKNLEKELKRQRLKNIRLKLHMEVLFRNPECNTAKRIRRENEIADFDNSTIHMN